MLSKRLQTIYDLVEENSSIINIGTDHALLEIALTKGKNVFCIGTDINEYSIQKSLKNIEKNNLKNKIFLIHSDGLEKVDIHNETLILSGLGTSTILKILENPKAKKAKEIIIQSNNHLDILRKTMHEKGYLIKEEKAIFENGYWYVIIVFVKGKMEYSKEEYALGIYINNKNYYEHLLFVYKSKLKKIPKKEEKRRKEIEFLIEKCIKKTH